MPAVPGILLDPVDQDLADRDPVRAEPLPEVRVPRQHRVGRGLLARQVRVRLVDHALVGDRAVEVRVVPPVQRRLAVVGDPPAPLPLHLREMADEAEQRHRRRRRGAPCELLGVEALALHEQRRPVARRVVEQRRELAVRAHAVGVARVLVRVHPHVRVDGCAGPPHGLGHRPMLARTGVPHKVIRHGPRR